MQRILFLITLALTSVAAAAGSSSDFDFWVGEWEVSWTDPEGNTHRGSNTISRMLDGKIIREYFVSPANPKLTGISVSAFDPERNDWGQTWVDDSGAYLDFRGGKVGKRMILSREAVRDGKTFHQRMIWYDIKRNSMKWNWERSTDGGESWDVVWTIHYTRKTR